MEKEEENEMAAIEKELSSLVRKSAHRVGPQIERFHRAFETAAKSEAKIYLRENGITPDMLTDEEYEFVISAIERKSPADSPRKIAKFAKEYGYRQLRRLHNPRKTATYLRYSFQDTLVYFLFFTFYMVLVYTTCHRLPWSVCIMVRLTMTIHLGYYNALWVKKIGNALYIQIHELWLFVWEILKFMPAVFFETMRVLFDVFIGWPLLGSIFGILFMLYIVPIAFPEMGLSSVFVELYATYIGDIPLWAKVMTLFV